MDKKQWHTAIRDQAHGLLKTLWETKTDREITRLLDGLRNKDFLVALALLVHRLNEILAHDVPFDE